MSRKGERTRVTYILRLVYREEECVKTKKRRKKGRKRAREEGKDTTRGGQKKMERERKGRGTKKKNV